MNMPVKEAVRIASKWVAVEVMGNGGYRVDYWDNTRKAWYEGWPSQGRGIALETAWESKVSAALGLLGIRDCDGIAHHLVLKNYPKDWRHSVREGIRIAKARDEGVPCRS